MCGACSQINLTDHAYREKHAKLSDGECSKSPPLLQWLTECFVVCDACSQIKALLHALCVCRPRCSKSQPLLQWLTERFVVGVACSQINALLHALCVCRPRCSKSPLLLQWLTECFVVGGACSQIKALLLNQNVIAGIGNWIADEVRRGPLTTSTVMCHCVAQFWVLLSPSP